MASFKKAIETIYLTEQKADEERYGNNKYATFKEGIYGYVFNSSTADKLFEDIWLANKYYDIISQEVANKLLELSSTLTNAIAKQMLKISMEQLCNVNIYS
ncbi:MAG: hypothetical protein FWE18_03295 [Alphaproteobacteria bacterium]|nr:hypothetical protein [Alphaproteobacteria bacterium]